MGRPATTEARSLDGLCEPSPECIDRLRSRSDAHSCLDHQRGSRAVATGRFVRCWDSLSGRGHRVFQFRQSDCAGIGCRAGIGCLIRTWFVFSRPVQNNPNGGKILNLEVSAYQTLADAVACSGMTAPAHTATGFQRSPIACAELLTSRPRPGCLIVDTRRNT